MTSKKSFFVLTFIVLSLLVAVVAVELTARVLYKSVELLQGYHWLVDTHLIDMPYAEYLDRQGELKQVREGLGMERGRSHSLFGFTYNPGFQMELTDLTLHINSFALRGDDFPVRKDTNEVRILCIGGSTTAGEEVSDDLTYPAQLQKLLQDAFPQKTIRVINAGIPSYDLKKSFAHYTLRLYELRPDFVTIYHGINDLFYHLGESPEIAPKRNYSGRDLAPFVFEGDARETYFGLKTWTKTARFLAEKSFLLYALKPYIKQLLKPRQLNEIHEGGIQTFMAYYRAFIDQIEVSGAVAVPITFAISYPGQFDERARTKIAASFNIWLADSGIPLDMGQQIIARQNREIQRLSQRKHIDFADAAHSITKDGKHFIDICHLTNEGNAQMATCLSETLIPLIHHRFDI